MNFGSKSGAPLVKQEATYHLAPNFTTRPFPNGPWQIGIVVEDLKRFAPLNRGDVIPVPEGEPYCHEARGIQASVHHHTSGELGFLAKVLDRSIGGDSSLRTQRSEEDIYEIDSLETVYFYPRQSYLHAIMELRDVADYLDETSYRFPVYLITGLKVARGAKVSISRSGIGGASAGIGSTPLGGIAVAEVEAKAAVHKASGTSMSHTEPTDFVLGIQVMKLYHKKKRFTGEKVLKKELFTRGAQLVDDETVKQEDQNYVVSELDEDEKHAIYLPV